LLVGFGGGGWLLNLVVGVCVRGFWVSVRDEKGTDVAFVLGESVLLVLYQPIYLVDGCILLMAAGKTQDSIYVYMAYVMVPVAEYVFDAFASCPSLTCLA
jgi:hypothetical protein